MIACLIPASTFQGKGAVPEIIILTPNSILFDHWCGDLRANTAVAMAIWLIATFALIAVSITTPSIEFYTGGIIIALFIAALFYVYGNAIRQGNELKKKQPAPAETPQSEENKEQSGQNNSSQATS